MDDEATVYESETRGDRASVAALLRRIADGIEAGRVELGEGEDRVVVEPPDDLGVELELELEAEGDEEGDDVQSSLEIEITW